ncbi:glycosyltransferase family 2 protein [Prosthecobacter sp.]|uniref:glycosyltransferase family 2 protein n=1 Tax=Prosthecobacter sp. TaxID=1965333 RepID=UPI002ABB11D0|nr:glycosyltransferase family 2 protein [Prosthecobacter sp.]MDZ4405783.1 glycosyltransferase family 2 protein [Prosthecobacter sp.]
MTALTHHQGSHTEHAVLPNPKVTVVIATYNWSSVLPYSIGSVLRQTRTDFELWVVGDACTDDSAQVVSAIKDPRVHWHNLPVNFGQQGGPNNAGIERARGDYIAYLGHDDLWLPHHLEALIPALDAGADFAWSLVSYILPDQTRWLMPQHPRHYQPGRWIPPTGLLHRKDLAQSIGGWRSYRDISIDPEADLINRMHAAGGTSRFVPRLTALKLPAALRKNVYHERPCHEQAAWMQKIEDGIDLEREELLAAALRPRPGLTFLLREGLRSLRWHARKILGYKKAVFDQRRKYKGLPPKD